jgi:murein DD-endopeptidase MepM/ murein hydrolase activator NlpD
MPGPAFGASADTAALQVAMRGLGLYAASVDGITGARTQAAVRAFQRRRGLVTDGLPGPRTLAALGRRGRPPLGSRTMRAGHRGWDVAALQFLLRSRGFGPGAVDGGFGPGTVGAVRRFQRAAALRLDDAAGPATLAALRLRTVVGAPLGDPVRFLRPVAVAPTVGFGWIAGRRHTGVDFPTAAGVPVGAAGRGVVSFAARNDHGYGNLVVISHRLGFESWYAHLQSIAVRPGQTVVGGTLVGRAGSTGHSTGPHLHFEARRFGTPIDPAPRFLNAVAATAGRRVRGERRLVCRANADARATRADPWSARLGYCP